MSKRACRLSGETEKMAEKIWVVAGSVSYFGSAQYDNGAAQYDNGAAQYDNGSVQYDNLIGKQNYGG